MLKISHWDSWLRTFHLLLLCFIIIAAAVGIKKRNNNQWKLNFILINYRNDEKVWYWERKLLISINRIYNKARGIFMLICSELLILSIHTCPNCCSRKNFEKENSRKFSKFLSIQILCTSMFSITKQQFSSLEIGYYFSKFLILYGT